MTCRHIEVEPLTPRIGVVVRGVDLGQPLSDAAFAEIHDAWMAHLSALHARSIHDIGATSGVRVPLRRVVYRSRRTVRPQRPWSSARTRISCATSAPIGTRTTPPTKRRPWGASCTFTKVPPPGDDTLFAAMYRAYEVLSEPICGLLDGITARHEPSYQPRGGKSAAPPIRWRARIPSPGGRRFVNAGITRYIEGIGRGESDALLDMLFEHVKNRAFKRRFR